MNEHLPKLDRKYVGLGNNPMNSKFSVEQPTTVYRVNGLVTRTIIENKDKLPVSVNVIGGERTNVFVDAGKRGTSVAMEGGIANRVVVWNPDRTSVDVSIAGGSLTDVVIFIPKSEKQSAKEYKRRKVNFSDRKMKRERVKIEEYDLDNLPRLE